MEMITLGISNSLKPDTTKKVLEKLDKHLKEISKRGENPIVAFEMFKGFRKPTSVSEALKKNPGNPYLRLIYKYNGKIISVDSAKLQKTENRLIEHIYGGNKIKDKTS
jgi:hypothetical protein